MMKGVQLQPSREHALSDGPGQAGTAGQRAHGRQPVPPSSPQPGHRKVRRTVLGQATADGEARYGPELLLKAPEMARKDQSTRGHSAFNYFSPKANISLCLLGLEILLKKGTCLAAHGAKPWK